MSEPPITGSPAADAVEAAAELSIRACVATPTRVVLAFEGEPDGAAAQEGANYKIVKALGSSRRYRTGVPEYDPASRVTVLRNPVLDVELADWLRVTVVGLRPNGPDMTHFVRVESELPLSEATSALNRPGGDTNKETLPAASGRTRWIGAPPGLVVVVVGLAALVVLGVIAMVSASTGDMGTISTAAFGVIGSVIGAFFGVSAGLGDRERVDNERRIEATKGQMLAAMMPEDKKTDALEMLKEYSPREPDARRSRG